MTAHDAQQQAVAKATEGPVTLTIDPDHSSAEFAVRHLMITTVRGRMSGLEGTIRWDAENPENSTVVADVDASTVDTGTKDRDDHLRSEDFFHVEEHPVLKFKSTRVEAKGDDGARVFGDLTIRGVTKEVALDVTLEGQATDPWGNERMGFTAETTIDRTEFGLKWNQALETGGFLVADKVRITLSVSAIAQSDE